MDQRIKAKTIGLPHGLPKRLTFKSGSDFSEVKCFAFDEVKRSQTQAPLRESQAFSPSLGRPLPRVLAIPPRPARLSVGVPGIVLFHYLCPMKSLP